MRMGLPSSRFLRAPRSIFRRWTIAGSWRKTMRSWTTLQPGENASCIGCHESKNQARPPNAREPGVAGRAQALREFHAPHAVSASRARSSPSWIATACVVTTTPGNGGAAPGNPRSAAPLPDPEATRATNEIAFSLRGTPVVEEPGQAALECQLPGTGPGDTAHLEGNVYLAGTTNALVNWISAQSVPDLLHPTPPGRPAAGCFP